MTDYLIAIFNIIRLLQLYMELYTYLMKFYVFCVYSNGDFSLIAITWEFEKFLEHPYDIYIF